mmetsp:Transcript_95800/g.247690  ORF Transcript_95800/g.247690 Transcript_95800/m.247690 type:complete len:237 (+) Transcript_95800:236-946(+)
MPALKITISSRVSTSGKRSAGLSCWPRGQAKRQLGRLRISREKGYLLEGSCGASGPRAEQRRCRAPGRQHSSDPQDRVANTRMRWTGGPCGGQRLRVTHRGIHRLSPVGPQGHQLAFPLGAGGVCAVAAGDALQEGRRSHEAPRGAVLVRRRIEVNAVMLEHCCQSIRRRLLVHHSARLRRLPGPLRIVGHLHRTHGVGRGGHEAGHGGARLLRKDGRVVAADHLQPDLVAAGIPH